MTVGTPEYNLDTFGIKYVKKSQKPSGSTPSTEKTPHGLDKPKDKLDLASSSPTSSGDNIDTTTSYGEASTGTHGSGKNTGANARTSEFGTYDSPKNTPQNNKIEYKKPEGSAGAPIGKAELQLAINKCKLLKVKALSGDANFKRQPKGEQAVSNAQVTEPTSQSGGFKLRQGIGSEGAADHGGHGATARTRQHGVREREPSAEEEKGASRGTSADTGKEAGDKFMQMFRESGITDNKEKGTGDKIPHEKLGDLPQGKDDKKVGGTEIEDEDGKSRKLQSPADRYKSEVREMAIDAIDMAMKTIAIYQDNKEKAIQEELIKEAYEAQQKLAGDASTNTSDGGSVNFTYSDVHQKKIKKE